MSVDTVAVKASEGRTWAGLRVATFGLLLLSLAGIAVAFLIVPWFQMVGGPEVLFSVLGIAAVGVFALVGSLFVLGGIGMMGEVIVHVSRTEVVIRNLYGRERVEIASFSKVAVSWLGDEEFGVVLSYRDTEEEPLVVSLPISSEDATQLAKTIAGITGLEYREGAPDDPARIAGQGV